MVKFVLKKNRYRCDVRRLIYNVVARVEWMVSTVLGRVRALTVQVAGVTYVCYVYRASRVLARACTISWESCAIGHVFQTTEFG